MAIQTTEVTDSPAGGTIPPPEASPDEIEQQIHASQQALASKLGLLEENTLGSVRETIGAVNDAVSSVQSVVSDPLGAVQSAVTAPIENMTQGVTDTVSHLVKEFDPSAMVRDRPLVAVGTATLAGVVTGLILFGRPKVVVPGGRPGLFDTLTDSLTSEVVKVGRELIGTLSRSIVDRAKTAVSSGALRNYSV